MRGVGVGLEAVEKLGVDGICGGGGRRESEKDKEEKERKKTRHSWVEVGVGVIHLICIMEHRGFICKMQLGFLLKFSWFDHQNSLIINK